jgi:hypothetical protein
MSRDESQQLHEATVMTDNNRPLPSADDLEIIPADEASDIQRVVEALELLLIGR